MSGCTSIPREIANARNSGTVITVTVAATTATTMYETSEGDTDRPWRPLAQLWVGSEWRAKGPHRLAYCDDLLLVCPIPKRPGDQLAIVTISASFMP